MERTIKRGDIFYADLNPVVGSEQGGIRPVLVISNNTGNRYSPTIIIAPITSRTHTKAKLPTHTEVKDCDKLDKDSIILLEQIRTIDKQRFVKPVKCEVNLVQQVQNFRLSGGHSVNLGENFGIFSAELRIITYSQISLYPKTRFGGKQ